MKKQSCLSNDCIQIKECSNDIWHFVPVDKNAQTFLCQLVNLELVFEHKLVVRKDKLRQPSKLFSITADGNCFFCALSYIITGRQTYHSVLRQKVICHM